MNKIIWLILICTSIIALFRVVFKEVDGEMAQPSAEFENISTPSPTSVATSANANVEQAPNLIPDSSITTRLNPGEEITSSESDITPTPTATPNQISPVVLFDFTDGEPAWYTVNDDVMGGISQSVVNVDNESGRLYFSGNVSLENNGGFASLRSQWSSYDLSLYDGLLLRVRGDGNLYRLRIRTETTGSEIAYTGLFATEAETWQEIYLPFSEMVPLYRGFIVDRAGPIDPSSIRSFGLMVTDKQEGDFSLEVDRIIAVDDISE